MIHRLSAPPLGTIIGASKDVASSSVESMRSHSELVFSTVKSRKMFVGSEYSSFDKTEIFKSFVGGEMPLTGSPGMETRAAETKQAEKHKDRFHASSLSFMTDSSTVPHAAVTTEARARGSE